MSSISASLPSEELRAAVGSIPGVTFAAAAEGAAFVVPDYMGPRVVPAAARVIQLQSAGYDGWPELLPPGVTLCSGSGVHDDATAEHAVGLLLAVLRGLPEAVRSQDEGVWRRMPGRQSLADRRVLILGYGSIGRALAERLLPMKARLTAVASRPREDELVGHVYGIDELPRLLPEAEAVVVLVPLSDATRGLLAGRELALLPDGAVVVNVARGPVLDTDAVLGESGRLRFALDVTDPEPLSDGHPLWSAEGVLITPHIAGGTTAMLPRVAALIRDQLERMRDGLPLRNVVSR